MERFDAERKEAAFAGEPGQPLCLADYEPLAKRRLPRALFGYIEGACEDNWTRDENRAALRQGLDDHHAGHYGRSRKVALKERFIDADLFDADDPLQRFQFDDAINK